MTQNNMIQLISRFAVVRFTAPGFHKWENAPDNRKYLSSIHRHLFNIEVKISLEHNDREIEFHDLLDFCIENFPRGDHGGKSCEMLAEQLLTSLKLQYGISRQLSVSVFEDNEVGAVISNYEV